MVIGPTYTACVYSGTRRAATEYSSKNVLTMAAEFVVFACEDRYHVGESQSLRH